MSPEVVVILNPELIPDAPKLTAEVQQSISAETEQLNKDARIIQQQNSELDMTGMKPPTQKYKYRLAAVQPEATGHFTIINYT